MNEGRFAELMSSVVLVCWQSAFVKGRFRAGLVVKPSRKSPPGAYMLNVDIIRVCDCRIVEYPVSLCAASFMLHEYTCSELFDRILFIVPW